MIRHHVVSSRLHLLPLNSVLNRLIFTIDARKCKSKALSGGMRRRLSVAMACICSPDILILDEPTTGLDPASRRQVWEVIENVKEGRSAVSMSGLGYIFYILQILCTYCTQKACI